MAKDQLSNLRGRGEIRELSVSETLRTLYTHRVAIMVVVGLSMALAIYAAFLPRRYHAEGTLWVQPGQSSAYAVSALASLLNGQTNIIVASEVEALQSRTLYMRVAKDLDLVNSPAFWGPLPFAMPDPKDRTLANPKTRQLIYKRMSRIIKVDNDPKDEIIRIGATTISPELSSKIVNTLINSYLAYLFEMRYGSASRTSNWLVDQIKGLKEKVDQDQEEITKLQEKLGIVGFGAQGSTYIYGQSVGSLQKGADDATIARVVAEAKLRYLKEANPNLIEGEISLLSQAPTESGSSQSLLQTLRASRAQESSNYARLLSQFGPNYPEVKQAKAQLDATDSELNAELQRIVNQAQLSYDAASSNEKMAAQTVQDQKTKVFGGKGDMVRFIRLMQDYAADRSLYEGIIVNLEQAGITAGLQAGDADIVDLAELPGKPQLPGPILILLGALVGGFTVGSMLAMWLGAMDRRINGPEQVERTFGIPMLARVPHAKFERDPPEKGGAMHLVVSQRSHYAEAMQTVRTSLLLARPGSPPKVTLITSSMPNEGKSTTAVNLAATFARHGSRVLLIDGDLRRGTIGKRFRLNADKGLSNLIARQLPLEEVLQDIPSMPGLVALTDGPRPPDPAVLIGSEEMRRLVDKCREEFDFVFLDSPPIVGISDALHLGQLVDAVVLVIRENVSNRKAVAETISMMEAAHLPVAGFVFNDVDPRGSGYSYGYNYQDYYRNYYLEDEKTSSEEVSK